MIAMLKSSPGGDLFGRVRCYPLSMFKVLKVFSCQNQAAEHYFKVRLTLFFPVRFLYIELLKYYDGDDNSIFEPAGDKLQIKSDITFHLYIRWDYYLRSQSPLLPSVPIQHLDTSLFNEWISANVSCMSSWCVSNQLLTSPFSVFFKARHLVGMALCSTSHAARQGTMSSTISLCLRTLSRASSAPKWRMVNE